MNAPAIIDSHMHMWDIERAEYGWLGPEFGVLNRTHRIDEIEPDLHRLGLEGAVVVQSANHERDTELMLEAADRHPWVLGVVGWVDLLQGAAVAAHATRLAADRRIVGVRHLIHNEPDPDWVVQPAVIEGLRALAAAGLAYDVVSVLPRHLEHVPTVAEAVPDLTIVIDHLSKPPLAPGGDMAGWSERIARAADHPNVYAKISGLDTAAGEGWEAADLRPAVDRALQHFTANRLMYGGDWPICVLGGGYERQFTAVMSVVDELSADEQTAILSGTARRAYGLDGKGQ